MSSLGATRQIDKLNPHITWEQYKALPKRSPPFAMPPPEGIIPQLCRAYERAIRNPYTWGKKKHYMGVLVHPNAGVQS